MRTVADRPVKPIVSPGLLWALLAMLCPCVAYAALPPAAPGSPAQPTDSSAAPASLPAPARTRDAVNQQEAVWALPPVQIGGTLSYDLRHNSSDQQSGLQQGQTATVNARTATFIWQPWFARVDGNLGFSLARSSSSSSGGELAGSNNSSQNVVLTGSGQLSVLAQSRFPFVAFFQRNDSRVSSDLSLADGYASQRYGFTQHYYRPNGDSMVGWERNTQTSDSGGRSKQDSLELNLSQRLDKHSLRLTGNRTSNTNENSGETAVQNNLSLQQSYTPTSSISVENTANISRSGYDLQQGTSNTQLLQLSSIAFWRPADQPAMTVNGGARVLTLGTNTTGFAVDGNNNALGAQTQNNTSANANIGVSYALSRFTNINAAANVNMSESNGVKSVSTSQSVGAGYAPDAVDFGSFRYNWSTSATASNETGGQEAQRLLSLQLGHNLNRSFKLDGGSTVYVNGSQSLSGSFGSAASGSEELASTQYLSHNASVSWDSSQSSGSSSVRLSFSDSRALDGKREFFQLVNFQASSNMPTDRYSSWTGNLTIQGVRQGANTTTGNANTPNSQAETLLIGGFAVNSGGAISYQNQRVFGVRRLRFTSDLRLNSTALLPLLGSSKDQETAAWDNRFDYSIGRTQLRLAALISRTSAQRSSFNSATGAGNSESGQKINKSIMFSVSRSFGDF